MAFFPTSWNGEKLPIFLEQVLECHSITQNATTKGNPAPLVYEADTLT